MILIGWLSHTFIFIRHRFFSQHISEFIQIDFKSICLNETQHFQSSGLYYCIYCMKLNLQYKTDKIFFYFYISLEHLWRIVYKFNFFKCWKCTFLSWKCIFLSIFLNRRGKTLIQFQNFLEPYAIDPKLTPPHLPSNENT